MNFFQLECFEMAVEKNSFIDVAMAMHVTPPTITYQITNLEEELGESLFLRSRKGVEVTHAGKLFYQDCKDILRQYRLSLEHFKHAVSQTDTVIRVGYTRPPDNYEFHTALHRFRADNPNIIVDFVQDEIVADTESVDKQFDLLLHYKHDLQEFSRFEYLSLGKCTYYVTVSQFSHLAERESLTLADLKGCKLLVPEEYKHTKFQVPSLKDSKKYGIDVLSYSDMNSLMYAIADDIGIGIYPSKYRNIVSGFCRVPLTDIPPLEYGLLYRKNHSASVESLLQYLTGLLKTD